MRICDCKPLLVTLAFLIKDSALFNPSFCPQVSISSSRSVLHLSHLSTRFLPIINFLREQEIEMPDRAMLYVIENYYFLTRFELFVHHESFFRITFPSFFHTYRPGGYSIFQVTGMIEWSQKTRPKKIRRASGKTQKKSLDQKLTPKKSHADFCRLLYNTCDVKLHHS